MTASLAGLLAHPAFGRDDRPKLIGRLNSGLSDQDTWGQEFLEPNLIALGWRPGRDFTIETRTGYSDPAQIEQGARELVAMRPDLLYTGGNAGAVPLRRHTRSIPIVVPFLSDPIGSGLAESIARPGGNVTGLAAAAGGSLLAKRLQLLTELSPRPRRVAVLWPARDSSADTLQEVTSAGRTLGLALDIIEANSASAFPAALERVAASRPDALANGGSVLISQQMKAICDLTLRHRIPAVSGTRQFARGGMLMSYGPSITDSHRRAAVLVDRILRGTWPGDLPIEFPLVFDLVVNLRTARFIGVTIPAAIVARADEIID